MKRKNSHDLVIILIFVLGLCFFPESLSAQKNEAKTIVKEAEKIYGSNDFIQRGLVYIPHQPKANGHPFFKNDDWNLASINFLGEKIKGIYIKYNVARDAVILQKHDESNHVKQPILINSVQIDNFEMNDHVFTNLSKLDTNYQLKGFGEFLYSGNIQFIRKFTKSFVNQYNKSNPYGLYSKLLTNYYLLKQNEVVRIYNKRSLVRAFPDIQKQLKKKLRSSKFRFKKASAKQWIEIISWCDNQTNK